MWAYIVGENSLSRSFFKSPGEHRVGAHVMRGRAFSYTCGLRIWAGDPTISYTLFSTRTALDSPFDHKKAEVREQQWENHRHA